MEPAMSIFKGVSVMDENNIGEDGGEQVLEVHGIRVIPGVIKFNGAFVGQTYRTHFSLQNVANKIVNVKICKPYSWAFRMNDVGKEFQLSPGLKISRMITFVCVQDSVFESTLPIQIEDQQLHLPIVVSKGETMIRVTPTVLDFGMLDLGCPFVTRCLRITNVGNCTSKFAIDLGPNHLDLFASPKKGRLAPKSTINVRVEMSGFYPGEFSDEFWVKCEPPQRVRVEVTILVPHLQACHPNTTEDFTLIDFKPTYYGCERFETLILRNVSSFQSMFVTMAELDSARLITLAEAEKNIAGYRNFSVQPIDGRLGPFEGRIFTVKFIPKIDPLPEQGWSHQQQTSLTTDRFIFVRIHRVDVIMKMPESLVDRTLAREDNKGENTAEMHVRTTSSVTQYPPLMDEGRNNMADKVDDNLKLTDDVSGAVRLCLYGAAVHPHIAVVPDCLYFGSVTLGECSTRVLTLENPSNLLPIGFSHTRIPYVDVTPKEGVLMPNKSIQLKVTLHASSTGIVQKHLRVNLLSHSDMTEKKGLKIIGREIVALQYEIVAKAKRPVPKIHRGITPAVTHEVGEHSEMVTYQAVVSGRVEIPELARRLIKGGARVWKLHPDAKVAFPNDMPHSLRPKSTDKAVVSIYTGKRRYVPPLEKKYAYTSKEIVERNKMKAAYAEFTSVTGNNIKEALKKREVPPPDEYSVSNSKLYQLLGMHERLAVDSTTEIDVTKSTLRCGYMVKESEVDLSRSPFIIPITPMHLYNIQLMPQTIDFGMIPENTKCVEKLVVENRNCFPVSVKLLAPAGSAVALPPGEIVVDRFSKSKQNIYLHLDLLGKYYSNISYVINTFHKYEIKVTANVVQRVLYLNPKEVTFGATKPYDIFQDESIPIQIMNPLKVPTKFLWKVPPSCPYRVEPMKGVVKGHDYLKCCVYFTGSHRSGHHNLSVAVFLQLVTHKGSVVRLKCLYRSLTQCSVSLLLEKMNVGPLPLGIKTTRSAIIFNSGRQDVTYSTQNQTTPPGVRVRPVTNIVKAKSCSLININFSVEAVQALDFYLIIDIQSLASLKLHIIGYVPYPKIHFSPHNVLIRSVECSSYCNIPIVASNKAPTQAIVQFETANFTQFNVSLSSDPIDPGIDPAGIVMEPGKSTTMYLHFAPICIASYQFYLPMKINHIIGYPVIENKNSIKTETYIKQGTSDVSKKWAKRLCKKKPICELTTPEYIDTIKVQCTVAEQKISFSQTEFNFVQTSSLSEKAPQGIVIYNHTGPPLKVALTLNALHNSPFSMTSPSGVEGVKDTICQDNPIPVCVFNVDKSIDFTITFNPSKPSSWVIDVAVYVLPETPNLRPYKHIRLSGVFHISTLFCQYLQVYLLPTPLGVPSEKKIVIIASHQERDTKLDARTEPNCPQLSATARIDFDYPNGSNIPACRDKFIIPVTIKFTSKRVTSFRTFVNFSDGCGGNARIELFVSADSSLLTTYVYKFLFAGKRSIGDEATSVKSHKLNKASIRRVSSAYEYENADPGKDKEETRICDCPSYCPCLKEEGTNEEVNPNVAAANEEEEFPRFPLSFDTTFGQFMLRTLKLVEDWLFEQGFQGSYRFKVGQHIAYSKTFGEALSSRSKTPCLKDVKSLVDLIVNLYGKEFLPRPVPNVLPTEDRQRILYCHNVYKLTIDFLNEHGACLCHVTPIALFDFEDYVYYFNNLRQPLTPGETNGEEPLLKNLVPKVEFERASVQSWLDVILQMYKCLVLKIAVTNIDHSLKLDTTSSTPLNDGPMHVDVLDWGQMLTSTMADTSSRVKNPEVVLIQWLNKTYEAERNRWEHNMYGSDLSVEKSSSWLRGKVPSPRHVLDLYSDLQDGVVLALVTAYYCPYLVPLYLYDVFLEPNGKHQYIHNTVVLTQAWKKIRIGLTVTPTWFNFPNAIQMLMLVTHLYIVLPSFLPKDTIFFSGSLSSHITRIVCLQNLSTKRVGFQVKILGDANNSFKVMHDSTTLTLKPQTPLDLNIDYFAKRLYSVSATLVLCGCELAGRFCSNVVYRLEGEATKFCEKESFKISVPICSPTFLTFQIMSPYEEQTRYELWYSEVAPKHGELEKLTLWSKERQLKMPRQLFLCCDDLMVPGMNSAKLTTLQQEERRREEKQQKLQSKQVEQRKAAEKAGGYNFGGARGGSDSAQEFCLGKLPSQHSPHQFTEETGMLPLYAACYQLRKRSFWVVFSNRQVGDFIIKITLIGQGRATILKLIAPVIIPPSYDCSNESLSQTRPVFSKVATINLPKRNLPLWTTVRAMFFLTLEEKEKPFWINHLETRIGLKLIKWMLGTKSSPISEEIDQIFQKEVVYTVTCSSPYAQINKTVKVKDVLEDGYMRVEVELSDEVVSTFSAMITMTADNKQEIRQYEVEFEYPTSTDNGLSTIDTH